LSDNYYFGVFFQRYLFDAVFPNLKIVNRGSEFLIIENNMFLCSYAFAALV